LQKPEISKYIDKSFLDVCLMLKQNNKTFCLWETLHIIIMSKELRVIDVIKLSDGSTICAVFDFTKIAQIMFISGYLRFILVIIIPEAWGHQLKTKNVLKN
jgi:hypothetical protein